MANTLQRNRLRDFVPVGMGELDHLFDQFFSPEGLRSVTGWRAPASLWEAEDKFHIEIDVPGVTLDDIELTFDKGTLKISLERKAPERERKYWHNERTFGQVTRSLSLPETANPESISAELNGGVLHVTIDKIPEEQPKRIEVKAN